MASVISVLAKISADTSAYTNGLRQAQSATNTFEKSTIAAGKKAGSGFASGLKGFIGPALFAGGIAGAARFGKALLDAGNAEVKANKLIENITTSMGQFEGQVGLVTDRLTKLAEAQALATGVDEDSIKASQAKLLTFSQVGASADKAGGLFDRATQAAMDLNAAGFGDMEGNAIRLGKALQDPVKGMNAMSRSGITFDKSQKDMIKSLVAGGKMAEAQGIIMAAVEQQVGGSAASQMTQTARMGQAYANLKETIGTSLLPAFDGLFKTMNDKVFPMLTAGAEKLPAVFATIGTAIGPTLQTIGNIFNSVFTAMQPAIDKLLPLVMQLMSAFSPFGLILKIVEPLIPKIFGALSNILISLMPAVTAIVKGIGDVAVILSSALEPILDSLVPILITFGKMLGEIIPPIMGMLVPIIGILVNALQPIIQVVLMVVNIFMVLMKAILVPIIKLFTAILKPVLKVIQVMTAIAATIIRILMPVIQGLIDFIAPAFNMFGDLATGLADTIDKAMNAIASFVAPILNSVIDGVNAVMKFLGLATIPKISTAATKTAYANGNALGLAKANGENAGYLKNRAPDATTGTTTGGGGESAADKRKKAIADTNKSFGELLKAMNPLKTVEVEVGKFEKSTVDSMKGITDAIGKAKKDGVINKGDAAKLTKYAKAANDALLTIAKRRDELDKALEKARKIKEDSAEFVKGLTDLYKGIQPLDRMEKEIGRFESSVVSGFDAINAKIADGEKIGLFGKDVAKQLKDYSDRTADSLKSIARQRDALAKSYAEMTDKLAAAKDFKKSIQDTLSGLTDITKLGGSATEMINNFKNVIQKTIDFQAQLKRLKDAGLNKTAFNNIVQAGIEAGGATANALLDGGPAAIAEVNSLYEQFNAISEATAEDATNVMYDGGISVIQGFMDGIVAQDAQLQKTAGEIATAFNTTFQKTVDDAVVSLDKMIEDLLAEQSKLETTAATLAAAFSATFKTQVNNAMKNIKVSVPATVVIPNTATSKNNATTVTTNVELNVSAGIGTNPVEVGKAVVDAISRYEKSSGTVFARV